MARCGCSGACACAVVADPDVPEVSVTGNGATATPYVVSVDLSGVGGGVFVGVDDTDSIDLSTTGVGTEDDPLVITGAVVLVPDGTGPLGAEDNPLKLDATGLYVDPALLGGGSMGDPFESEAASSGLTTATTLYSAGDQMGALLELTDVAAASGGWASLVSGTLLCDTPGVIGPVRAWIFRESVTLNTDNSAFSLSDADADKCVGQVVFPNPGPATNCALATAPDIQQLARCDATSLFVALETLTTHTAHFTAADDLHLVLRGLQLT